MAEQDKNEVGFDCEFLERPPEYLQNECPVCLLILRNPHQVTCCGKSFCQACIKRVQLGGKPCPCCKQDNFNDFHNKGLQQPLYGFKVYCSNKEDGCDWTGELGQLDKHLNFNEILPDKDHNRGCKFVKVKCSYCSETVSQKELVHHKNEVCYKRPFSCEYCKDQYISTYEDVVNNHWSECGHFPVPCPNECGSSLPRRNIKSHLALDCPLTVVECDFSYTGCEVRLPRMNMQDHLRDGLVTHFSLLALRYKQQQDEIKLLKEDLNKLKSHVSISIAPVEFTVDDPFQYTYNKPWISPHFYTHFSGYKLCIHIFRQQLMNEFYVCPCLMQGEFDSLLDWPLRAVVKIQLLDVKERGADIKLRFNIENGRRVLHSNESEICRPASISYDNLTKCLDNYYLYILIRAQV